MTELDHYAVFDVGDKVRLKKKIRNDGTFLGKEKGDILAEPGEEGYVSDVGTYLQTTYIYAVHFIEKGIVIGCRANELELIRKG